MKFGGSLARNVLEASGVFVVVFVLSVFLFFCGGVFVVLWLCFCGVF